MNASGKAKCGDCPKGWTNLGAMKCKKAANGDKELSGKNDSKAKNLKACTGECDGDKQCAMGLRCFERSNGEKIPGCKGAGGGKDWDYCYNPLNGGIKELGGPNDSKAKNLGRCWGECDGDKQCAYGLKCFERSKGEPIPGCKDGKKKMPANYDYCYDPNIVCLKNNGGCDKARKCMNVKGKAMCGDCPKGWTNLGAMKCKKAAPAPKCGAGSAASCKATVIKTPGYSTGDLIRVTNGKKVRKSTEKDSCPMGYKIWSPRNKNDWTIVYNLMKKNIKMYPAKPHLIVDVTRAANGCGGCAKYAMKSTTAQQGSWKTKDGSAWWLRDSKYNEPNGDYHANCYLQVYDVNPSNVRFNDGNCNYYTTDYLCQKAMKPKPAKTVVAYQVPDARSGCPNTKTKAGATLISKKVTVAENSYVMVTGHMIRSYKGRADLYLNLNNKKVDHTLTYTPLKEWKDAQVYWVGSIAKGSHTFSITGSRANAFGCGGAWGDLDILVIPNLPGVAAYQFGVKSGCPQKGPLKFKKDITLAQDSVVFATGHMISQGKSRADLSLYINNGFRDVSLTEDTTNQWNDGNVLHATTLKKGKHTFELRGNKDSMFGCGEAWGDLDVLVVPKFKGVAAYNSPDKQSGCPANRKAGTDLIKQEITLDQTSIVKVAGHMIRNYKGRADAYLYVDGKARDWSLSYTADKRWEDVKLHYITKLPKGKHTFSIRSNRANAFGCGGNWGDIDILVLPEKMSAA